VHPKIDLFVRRQHGLVTRSQLSELGFTSRQIEGLVRSGQMVRAHRTVFRDQAVLMTDDQRRMAAVLAGGDRTVVSHRAAAAHHGLDNFSCGLVEVIRPLRRSARLGGGTIVHRSELTRGAWTMLRRVRVTTPLRTVLDLPTVVNDHIVSSCIEQWTIERKLSLDALHEAVAARSGERGNARLRAILERRELGRTITDSPAESAMGRLLVQRGLQPVHHHLVAVRSGATFELDFAFPAERVALEIDGYGIHLRSFEAFDDDRWRRNELELDGWLVLNFSGSAVRRRPDRIVQQVRSALELRAGS
jgi:very-short-patch-repair endonuclease